MTIQWHLTTRPTVDVLQISGYLGDDAVTRFNGAVGWALARGEQTLLLDCTHLKGWSTAGQHAVATAAHHLTQRQRRLELVCPPDRIDGILAHSSLAAALDHHQTTVDEQSTDAWHTSRWDTDSAT
ncbi:STAS domain-containing protein [Streptacidiphilus sp. MAP5-52]|uniref:STAS domain-containing protein n=1 Tax=Streptacidiphilus sp. MAP5-52 TaxID=3156267 RepID=UPI003514CE3A